MDPTEQAARKAEPGSDLHHAVSAQGNLLGQHSQVLRSLGEGQHALQKQLDDISRSLSALFNQPSQLSIPAALQPVPVPTPPTPVRDVHIPDPRPFSGELGKCRGFLLQCTLIFDQKPLTYSSDRSKVSYIIGLLTSRALTWAEAYLETTPLHTLSLQAFTAALLKVFDGPVRGRETAKRLMSIRQGNQSVAEFSVEFRTLAADSGWNSAALMDHFLHCLTDTLKDELATRDLPATLDSLIDLATRLDNRLRERTRERRNPHPGLSPRWFPPSSPEPSPDFLPVSAAEPMQVGRTHLTPTERQRRLQAGACLYCGEEGHFRAACPVRPKDQARQFRSGF